jgi:phospholipid/cholesterol/gamma-HCH transport system substrate-binding protein
VVVVSALHPRPLFGPFTKLAVFAIVTVILTGLLAQSLGSLSFGGTAYRARFTDVTGLLPGDDIRIAGVKVGQVKGIKLVGDDDGSRLLPHKTVAEVKFTVDGAVPLQTSVHARIRYRNLVGQRYVALTEGTGGAPRLNENGLIPLSQTAPALDLTVVFNGFRPLFTGLTPSEVNRLSFEIIQVLQGEGGTLAGLLQHTASLTNTLADRDAAIGRVITNLNAVLETLDERDRQLDETIHQLQLFVSGLAADRKAIGDSLSSISNLATTTGDLLHDARPDLAQDVTLLNQLAGTLNDNTAVIENSLATLPGRYTAMTNVASTGSWFNFFLCDFDGRVGLAPGVDVATPTFSSASARCSASGSAP